MVAGASAVAWLPWLLFALPGGVLVDRMDRRRLMIVIDLVRVVALAVLATAILTGRGGVALLFAVLFLVNTGEIVFRAASQAMVPIVVPRHRLERANGWLSGGATLMHSMLAGPLGGFLFALSAGSPFLVNAITYALSAVLVALIGGDSGPSSTTRRDATPARCAPRSSRACGGWPTSGCCARWPC
ncbi:MFS transporter [Micromonospora sp. M12]